VGSVLSGVLQKAANDAMIGTAKVVRGPSIVEFVEASWGLNYKLFPAQRFVLKLFYNLPLEATIPDIVIKDPFSGEVASVFTEVAYLEHLRREGRVSGGVCDPHDIWKTLVLVIGRRGSKSEIAALIAVYETWRLLCLKDPQSYYGLPRGEYIDILCIATEKDQAATIFARAKARFLSCPFFAPFIASDTLSSMRFRTQADIDKNGKKAAPSLRVGFRSSNAKGLRGKGYIVVILDELAYFQDDGLVNAYDVWEAVTPATATFTPKDPKDNRVPIGPSDGRVIAISSPASTVGKFYDLYKVGMDGDVGMLVVQAPTWEINPSVPTSEYAKKFRELKDSFWSEFGAQFVSTVKKWIERAADLADCVFEELRPTARGIPRRPYFVGLDLGLTAGGSGTALSVTHIEDDAVVLDLIDGIRAGEGRFEHRERLDVEEDVIPWFLEVHGRFNVHEGMIDQFNGYMLEQHLHRMGLKQYKAVHVTQDLKSNQYQRFKLMMYDRRVRLYNLPSEANPESEWADYIQELLDLEAKRSGYNIVSVKAPHGKKDDFSDALVRAVWLASERMADLPTSGRWRAEGPIAAAAGGKRAYDALRERVKKVGDPRRDPRLHQRFSRFRGILGPTR